MADEYQGRVRFGIVDIQESEMLKLTFEVFTLPQTFYLVNGTAYEMNVLNIFYDNVRAFIEGNYLNETKRYKTFSTPRYLVNDVTKFYYYAYNDGLKYYNSKQYDIFDYLKQQNYTEYEQVGTFFTKYNVIEQFHLLLWMALFVLLCTLIFASMIIRGLCFIFCGKAKAPQVDEYKKLQ